jgi:hypothetical protein
MAARIVVTIGATGFTDLTLGEGTVYRLPPGWLNAGNSDFRKQFTNDANVAGRVLSQAVLDVVQFSFRTEIGEGSTPPTDTVTLLNALDALIQRVRTVDWTFQVAYDSAVMKWTCEPAAAAPDFNRMFLQGWLPVTVAVTRDPKPVTGPF